MMPVLVSTRGAMNSFVAGCLILVVICVVLVGIFFLVSAVFGSTAGGIAMLVPALVIGFVIAANKERRSD